MRGISKCGWLVGLGLVACGVPPQLEDFVEPVDGGLVSAPQADAGAVVEQDDAGLIIAEPDAGSGLTPDAGTRDAGAPPPPGAGNPGDVHAGGAVSALENCTLYPFSAQARRAATLRSSTG